MKYVYWKNNCWIQFEYKGWWLFWTIWWFLAQSVNLLEYSRSPQHLDWNQTKKKHMAVILTTNIFPPNISRKTTKWTWIWLAFLLFWDLYCTVTVAPIDPDDCIYICRAISIYPYGTLWIVHDVVVRKSSSDYHSLWRS